MADQNIEKLQKETYLKMIENSVGSRLFNSAFVRFKDSGETKDICNDGEYSCAFFASGVLQLVKMIDGASATVNSLSKKLQESSVWRQVDDINPGDVIFWEEIIFSDGSKNKHVGFALNNKEAISTDYKKKEVTKHHITFGENKDGTPKRKIASIYRYKNF